MRFKNIYCEAKENAELSLLSLWTPGNHVMREAVKEVFEREPLMAEPVFQSMFPWQQTSDPDWKSYLNADAVKKLGIGVNFPPYQHQTNCWKELNDGNSAVVTSGTGSGKTECFLYPVLSDIYEQKCLNPTNGEDPVQAIFLYPLNALMEDQKARLGKACNELELKYAVYNSSLTEDGAISDYPGAEVVKRSAVRGIRDNSTSCPQILLTNSSMLEYMLVRDADKPIFERSQGKLRWIVIDEAHTYTGSAAIELAYLIRRVLNAFGVSRDDVRIVCTSATIGDPNQPSQLIDFIESIIGKYTPSSGKKLKAISGDRIPFKNSVADIDRELSAQGITQTNGTRVDALRYELNRRPMALSEMWTMLTDAPFNREDALDLLDRLTDIKLNDEFLLMARGHFFIRQVGGLYCCPDHKGGVAGSFGRLTTEKGNGRCPECGKPLFEIVQCGDCKEFLLVAEEDDNHNLRPSYTFGTVDDDLDPSIFEETDEEDQNASGNAAEEQDTVERNWIKRYLADYAGRPYSKPSPELDEYFFDIEYNGSIATLNEMQQNGPWVELLKGNDDVCATCTHSEGDSGRGFKAFVLSADWANTTLAPAFLKECAAAQKDWGKYIAFTDSRQGTSNSAKRFNIDSERRYSRMALMGKLSKKVSPDMSRYQNVIDYIRDTFPDDADDRIATYLMGQGVSSTPYLPELSLREAADVMFNQELFDHIDYDIAHSKGSTIHTKSVDAYKSALVVGQIARKVINLPDMENIGIATIVYPQITGLNNLPNNWMEAGFTIDDYKDFLKITLDYIFRVGNHYQDLQDTRVLPVKQYLRDSAYSTPFDPAKWPHIDFNNDGTVSLDQSRLVLLLCAGLGIDDSSSITPAKAGQINSLLDEVKTTLVGMGLLTTVVQPYYQRKDDNGNVSFPYDGWLYLDMTLDSEVCKLKKAEQLYSCPVKNRFMDTIFKGYSPNIKGALCPENIARFKVTSGLIKMPVADEPSFDADIAALKGHGFWSDLLKYVNIPVKSCYLAAEHSGQQNRDLLKYYTDQFKTDSLNLLQCSTTMEMGVDIGSIDTVFMANVPPTSANYLQRAGRAGRSGQSRAVAISLCPVTSIGVRAFRNTMMNLVAINPAIMPVESTIIVQRHMNSFFVKEYVWNNSGAKFGTVREWFTKSGSESECDSFRKWIRGQRGMATSFAKKFSAIFGPSADMSAAIDNASVTIDEIGTALLTVIDHYDSAIADPNNSDAKKSLFSRQKTILLEQDLKGYLAEKQFLPNANMPTGIVEFNYMDADTQRDLDKKNREIRDAITAKEAATDPKAKKDLQDKINKLRSELVKISEAHKTSREMKLALSEYAPGQTVVINEKNYISAGIENFNSFSTQNPVMYLYHCENCGRYEYTPDATLTACPDCGHLYSSILSPKSGKRCVYVVEPIRFRSDINRGQDRREETSKTYYEIKTVLTNVEWQNRQNGPLCEIVQSKDANGEIVYYNAGKGHGFNICWECGRMEVHYTNRQNNAWRHKSIKELGKDCNANYVENGVILAGKFPTTFVSMRFFEDNTCTKFVNNEQLVYSLGVLLQRALANVIGIQIDDIDFGVREELNGNDKYLSLYIFDTSKGGCGYSTRLFESRTLEKVFEEAKRMLYAYPCTCHTHKGGACVQCLIDRYSQKLEGKLSKYELMKWFSSQNMTRAKSPSGVPAVMTSLKSILTGAVNNANIRSIELFADAGSMNVDAWALRHGEMGMIIDECVRKGKHVSIHVANLPDHTAAGVSAAEVMPFVDFDQKFSICDKKVDCIKSLEFRPGEYSALILNGKNHYFTTQEDVLTLDENWAERCQALYEEEALPSHVKRNFPSAKDVKALLKPSQVIRTANITPSITSVAGVYRDFVKPQLLSEDEADIRAILSGKDVKVDFSDSFINSGFSILMLVHMLKSLRNDFGFRIADIDLKLKGKKRACTNPRYNPYECISNNFATEDEADEYLDNLIQDELEIVPNISNLQPDHYRWLKITPVGSNQSVEIRPDQGFHGGWYCNRWYRDLYNLGANTTVTQHNNATVIVYYLVVNRG